MVLYLRSYEYIIYDGPLILSNTLPNKHVQNCSTFQCIIYFLTQSPVYNHSFYFKFHSKFFPTLEYLSLSPNNSIPIILPTGMCSSHICILNIKAKDDIQVNATVTKINSSRVFDPICILSGLVIGEKLKGNYRQTDNFL